MFNNVGKQAGMAVIADVFLVYNGMLLLRTNDQMKCLFWMKQLAEGNNLIFESESNDSLREECPRHRLYKGDELFDDLST